MTRSCLFPAACALMLIAIVAAPLAAEPTAAASRIESVTLYRGQALVTRLVDVPAETGDLELLVTGLPAAVVGSSLGASAESPDGIAIRSVRFQSRAVAEAVTKEVAELDAKIKDLRHQLFANEQMMRLLEARSSYLDKLEQFVAPTAQAEMTKGVLNAETLTGLTQMVFEQRGELTDRRIELTVEAEALREQLALAERQRAELSKAAEKALNEAVVFLSKPKAGPAAVRLQYLVGAADWSPAYNLHLDGEGQSAQLEYLAEIRQMSGEDWSGVRLTLSTATPQLNAESLPLSPLWVDLAAPAPSKAPAPSQEPASAQVSAPPKAQPQAEKVWEMDKIESLSDYAQARQSLSVAQQGAQVAFARRGATKAEAGWELNRLAAQAQRMEMNVSGDILRAGAKVVKASEEGLAVSYVLEGKMSLASRNDRQLVQIAAMSLPAKMYYEAAPLLANFAYRCAEVSNTGALPLLGGPYSAYMDGEFVGVGRLPVVARGQNVTVGFGVDTQLRCRRELADKSDEVSWGSRVQTFHYRLRLENFKDVPVQVRLMDRTPACKTEDVRIELAATSAPLSTDEVYVRDLKPAGILRWDIALDGQAAGAKAKDITYTFQMRYAKDKAVGGYEAVENVEAMKAAFDKVMAK